MSHLIWQMPQDNAAIVEAFEVGKCFAYPTEAVWGIGANPADEKAVQAVIALKARPVEKGLIMVAANWQQFSAWVAPLSAQEIQAMERLQAQRSTTFILPAGEKVAQSVCDEKTGRVAVRVSAHPIVQALCQLIGQPLLSTSANLAGQAPALSINEVQKYFPDMPCVAGALGGEERASRIIDWQSKAIVRE